MKTVAESFFSDPRVAKAKRLILEALSERRAGITGPGPPRDDLRQSYEQTIKSFSRARAGDLFYPYLVSGIGAGPLVELADGSVKYDFISGIGVHHWGHSNPLIMEAMIDAALRDTVMEGNLQQDVVCAELADLILSQASKGDSRLAHCFFTSSGAMANENALKLIFQKKSPASRVLAFEGCFAGRTLALSQVTDKPDYRRGLPPTIAVDYIPFFDALRPEESTEAAVKALEKSLARYPGAHAAMVFELIQGEGGFYPGDTGFFVRIMELLRKNGVAVMVDEVQTFGRTPELFAFEYFGLAEYVDVVTIGKMTQVCAALFTDEYEPLPGLLSQTFTASASAFFAARVMLTDLVNGGYFGPEGRIARLSGHFAARLEEVAQRRPDLARGPYGLGAMIAFTPLGGEFARVKAFLHALFDAGVISFYCGARPTRARFLVPIPAVDAADIDEVVGITEQTLKKMAQST